MIINLTEVQVAALQGGSFCHSFEDVCYLSVNLVGSSLEAMHIINAV